MTEIERRILRNQADLMIAVAVLINEDSRRRHGKLTEIARTLIERADETKESLPRAAE